ncbi:hypothetical protein NP493_590g03082 [Ridgeia piscesae]|uniref:EGF-like domain-containing protein n=1 Tax=Ridgeia piscesae TaxID=27915 RepID=A0AAD9KUA5_RIDPI|nr:hypothetical protein NP493_590g03082 [Ridgeia piscesae]
MYIYTHTSVTHITPLTYHSNVCTLIANTSTLPIWTGPKYCEVHSPCQNGGTCVNLAGGSYVCVCPKCNCSTAEPFGDCEVDVRTLCADVTCVNGGSCEDTRSGFKCHCTAGYTGDKCQQGQLSLLLLTSSCVCPSRSCCVLCLRNGIVWLFLSDLRVAVLDNAAYIYTCQRCRVSILVNVVVCLYLSTLSCVYTCQRCRVSILVNVVVCLYLLTLHISIFVNDVMDIFLSKLHLSILVNVTYISLYVSCRVSVLFTVTCIYTCQRCVYLCLSSTLCVSTLVNVVAVI